jgi:hypothetical protein
MLFGQTAVPDLTDFRLAFLLTALLALTGVAGSFRLAKDAGQTVSGHRTAG